MSKITPLSPYESAVLRWMRVLAALMVFFCHVFQSEYLPIPALGQSLNCAVPIFFIMSGMLLSKQVSTTGDRLRWLSRRFLRLLIPYWLCYLFYLLATSIITGSLPTIDALWNVLPISGLTEHYPQGGGHLWYITHILICYIFTLLLYRGISQIEKTGFVSFVVLTVAYVLLLFLCQHFIPGILCVLIASVYSFLIGFFY